MRTIAVAIAAVAVATVIWVQNQQNRRLRLELEELRQNNTRLESRLSAPSQNRPASETPNQPNASVGVDESELLRLRGLAARATRAEAENAELRRHLAGGQSLGTVTANPAPPASDTLSSYLGEKVEPPANLDPRYTKDGLTTAIQLAAQKAGISLRLVEIDESEFPFLTGVVSEPGDWAKLKLQLSNLEGYEFHGSVGDDTRHTLCLVPSQAYPAETAQGIRRRMSARLEQFYHNLDSRQN